MIFINGKELPLEYKTNFIASMMLKNLKPTDVITIIDLEVSYDDVRRRLDAYLGITD